jgi:general secretion pathway protein G
MMQRIRKMREQEGFTLIELLIVIVILGVLAAIVVFAVAGVTDRGTKSACKSERSTVQTASEAYYAKVGSYAANLSDLWTAPNKLMNQPTDWTSGNSYTHNGYTITYTPTDGSAAGDITAAPVTTDCSA